MLVIKSPKELAKMMAVKARLLQKDIEKALSLEASNENLPKSRLMGEFENFKHVLVHDLDIKSFSDIYAQTLAYGMFTARLHDESLDTFSRQEAAGLIPKSNPFLRSLFDNIAGIDIDDSIVVTVDNLAEVFCATDVKEILKNFGRATQTQDPIIHFYETFLAEYDPKLRKSRGVWYTPEPVVQFIVRGVDEILKNEFGVSKGLADKSKTTIEEEGQAFDGKGRPIKVKKEVHKVQVLDPATGTGTFLAEVFKFIYNGEFKNKKGAWGGYVAKDLIPRLNGFEVLMASYAMAHLKMDMLMRDTGAELTGTQRFNIFLTNTLEGCNKNKKEKRQRYDLFSSLSVEAKDADKVKLDTPVMVVIGNPPYSGISQNNGKDISGLINDYKYIDGEHFGERKHWLNDDYVKFIRYGEHCISENREGVLAYINNHSFLDNPTFRGMRWHLLDTFDEIYIIDLHGNSLKKEVCPDGSPDKNVFDIQAGVSINFFIKTGKKKKGELAQVFHTDFWGSRQSKYDRLTEYSLESIEFDKIQCTKPYYFFVPKEDKGKSGYEQGFLSSKLFRVQSMGITTARDSVAIDFSEKILEKRISKFIDPLYSDQETRSWLFPNKKNGKYLAGDSRGWSLSKARKEIAEGGFRKDIISISYRPFDTRKIIYSNKMVDWCRYDVMSHMMNNDNLALSAVKLGRKLDAHNYIVTNNITDKGITSSLDNANIFPLYLYPEADKQQDLGEKLERTPNLDDEIVKSIAKGVGLTFEHEKSSDMDTFAPIDLLDYIYAVLYSPTYRETYKEFLKIDFPRIPYPSNTDKFWSLVSLGGELRQIHLLESPSLDNHDIAYCGHTNKDDDYDNKVTRKITKNSIGYEATSETHGKVWINDKQYFDNVPLVAWEFYIGGYQPAQKWLKDRSKEQINILDDIDHYMKIIVALTETHRIMQEIDKVG